MFSLIPIALSLLCKLTTAQGQSLSEDSLTSVIDRSQLTAQIGSIVAGYVILVAITLGLLLSVGRRLRRATQIPNYPLQAQMMRPIKSSISTNSGPVTPRSTIISAGPHRTWAGFGWMSRSRVSDSDSMDASSESVVASDQQKAQEDLGRLYAAVMEYDEQRAATSRADKKSPSSTQTNPFADPPSIVSEESPEFLQQLSQVETSASVRPSSRLSKISSLSPFNLRSPLPSSSNKPHFPAAHRKLQVPSPVASQDATAVASYAEDQRPPTPRLHHPRPPPQALSSRPNPRSAADTKQVLVPVPLDLYTAPHRRPYGCGPLSLPFRDAYPLQIAPATETTIIERPVDPRLGPQTGARTLYSPYMPFTPVTPLTPSRIVTKRQRKQQDRENGFRVLGEDDMVKGYGETWG